MNNTFGIHIARIYSAPTLLSGGLEMEVVRDSCVLLSCSDVTPRQHRQTSVRIT